MDSKKLIGQRIATALVLRNKKQKELAKAIGVTDNTVSYFCSGSRTPNLQQLIAIADELGVTTDYLLGRTKVKSLDVNLQAVCEYTNLSEMALDWLRSIKDDSGCLEMLNSILENKTFQALLPTVNELKNVQISAEVNRWFDDDDYVSTQEIGYGKYVVGGYEYLSVLEYRIAEYFKMVIDDVTRKSLDDIGG